MRARLGGAFLVIGVWCVGCASQPVAPIAAAVAPGQSRISITRADDGPSWGAAAHIDINGAHAVDLAPGQTYTGGVAPGPVSLTATAAMDIGQYTVRFNALAGKTYRFQVSRRGEQIAAGALGGLVGVAIDTAANGDNSGAFKITQVAP